MPILGLRGWICSKGIPCHYPWNSVSNVHESSSGWGPECSFTASFPRSAYSEQLWLGRTCLKVALLGTLQRWYKHTLRDKPAVCTFLIYINVKLLLLLLWSQWVSERYGQMGKQKEKTVGTTGQPSWEFPSSFFFFLCVWYAKACSTCIVIQFSWLFFPDWNFVLG